MTVGESAGRLRQGMSRMGGDVSSVGDSASVPAAGLEIALQTDDRVALPLEGRGSGVGAYR